MHFVALNKQIINSNLFSIAAFVVPHIFFFIFVLFLSIRQEKKIQKNKTFLFVFSHLRQAVVARRVCLCVYYAHELCWRFIVHVFWLQIRSLTVLSVCVRRSQFDHSSVRSRYDILVDLKSLNEIDRRIKNEKKDVGKRRINGRHTQKKKCFEFHTIFIVWLVFVNLNWSIW